MTFPHRFPRPSDCQVRLDGSLVEATNRSDGSLYEKKFELCWTTVHPSVAPARVAHGHQKQRLAGMWGFFEPHHPSSDGSSSVPVVRARSRASSVWPRAVATSCSARRHGTAAFSRSTPSRVFGEQGSGSWWFVRGGLYHITLLQLAGCNRIPASDGTIREQ